MKRTLVSAILFAVTASIFACSSSDNNTNPGTGGSGAGGGGNTCYPADTSYTDGNSACESVTNGCPAGKHCTSGGVNCLDGCLSTANCGKLQYCDLTAGTKDMEGNPNGVCRPQTPIACPAGTGGSSGGGTGGTGGGGGGSSGGCQLFGSGTDSESKCLAAACDSAFKAAFGDNYMTAPGGVCQSFVTCVAAAGCTEAAAQTCVLQASSACQSAAMAASKCVNDNEAKCAGDGGTAGSGQGGGGGSGPGMMCSLLKGCCDTGTFPDESTKNTCYKDVSDGNEVTCQSVLNTYKMNGYCI